MLLKDSYCLTWESPSLLGCSGTRYLKVLKVRLYLTVLAYLPLTEGGKRIGSSTLSNAAPPIVWQKKGSWIFYFLFFLFFSSMEELVVAT